MARADELDPLGSIQDWIAFDLRRFRHERGLSQQAVARILDVQRSAVHNYESAFRPLDIDHARKLDREWSTGGHFERLATHAARRHDSDWFQQFARYEQRARRIRAYEALIVPGLLQTPDYARAFLRAGGFVEDVESAVSRRMTRQTILDRDKPPRLQVLLEEDLLHRPMGGAEVMRAQLAHLLDVGRRPDVSIRVVPTATGGHVGLDGAFQIIETPSDAVAYLEAQREGRLLRGVADVERMAVAYDRIGDQAHPVGWSRRLITTVMEAMT